jgi:RimJ/RimL family protein N-acetyltransferase
MQEYPRLTTRRLLLRPFAAEDAADVERLAGDFAVADTTLEIPHPYEPGMAAEWFATHRPKFDAGEMIALAITTREGADLIGAVGLGIRQRFDRAELGYWVGKPYWGKGYATEAARALMDYGFRDLRLNRIFAVHFRRNPASGRVMQKLGMTQEGLFRQHIKKWDRYEDEVIYGMLRSDWEGLAAEGGRPAP